MQNWLNKRQESNAARKSEEAEAIAAFLAGGQVKVLAYSDQDKMKKIQKNWNRQISPSVIAQKEEDEKFLIFSKEDRYK